MPTATYEGSPAELVIGGSVLDLTALPSTEPGRDLADGAPLETLAAARAQ